MLERASVVNTGLGGRCFPTFFSLSWISLNRTGKRMRPLLRPRLMAAWVVTLSLLPRYSFALPGSKHMVLTLFSAGWGLGWFLYPPATLSASAPLAIEPAQAVRNKGPNASVAGPLSLPQPLPWLTPAHRSTDASFGLLPPAGPPPLVALLPHGGDFTPGEATQHSEVLSGSASRPSHCPTTGAWVTARTAVGVEQVTLFANYLLSSPREREGHLLKTVPAG